MLPRHRPAGARARRTTASLLAAAGFAGALAGPAGAEKPTAAAGGTPADTSPVVTSVSCSGGCTTGSKVTLAGSGLEDVVAVSFTGAKGSGDDVLAQPEKTTDEKVVVLVPGDARRGPVVAFNVAGEDSEPSAPVDVVTPRAPKSTGGGIATAVTTRKAYFDGARKPTLSYQLETSEPAEVSVQVVRERDGAVVKTYDEGTVEPGERRVRAWNGKVRGKPAPDGRYAFVVVAEGETTGLLATGAQDGARGARPDGFRLLGHRFPIRGKHSYGSATAMYGGGRGHQGVDVFADCGTPLVAARGGVVKIEKWQNRAGNYVVIDGAGTDVDYAYMHLQAPALVEQRERVRTGQLIGYVGDTGRAFGCHLHFEEWSGPGWYTGGSPFDPLPDLRAWDAVS